MTKRAALSILFVVILFRLFPQIYSANVLCVFTDCVYHNLIVFMSVANALIKKGHNVTIITTIPIPAQSFPKQNFHHINLGIQAEKIHDLKRSAYVSYNESSPYLSAYWNFYKSTYLHTNMQMDAIRHEKFQQFFRENNTFDLMVLGYFYNDFMVGIAARYGCPIAVISLCSPFSTLNRWIGNPSAISYVQISFTGRSVIMSFVDRFRNVLLNAIEPFVYYFFEQLMANIYRNLFKDDFYPPYSEMIKNISLVLYNRHFSEMPIRPLVPALVEIGGIHVEDQSDYLLQEIKEFVDASENGTIFFRVGSEARSTRLSENQLEIIFNVLSKLDLTVVWEWERPDAPPTKFSNIRFSSSVIPNTILPHRNLKLYITDGRPLAIQEAIYHGVPMLGLPLFGEEPYNVAEMTNSGLGLSLDVNTMTEESFNETLVKVLESQYYVENVKRSAQLVNDRPNTARETAAFWLEYVIRYRGALHMQSPLVHMNFIQRWNIDVIVVLIVILWVSVKLVHTISFLVRKIVDLRTERFRALNKPKQL